MLYIIQFLGRWGSAVVERHVGNAFIDVAAAASLGGGQALQHSLASCVSSLSSGGGSSSDVGAVGIVTTRRSSSRPGGSWRVAGFLSRLWCGINPGWRLRIVLAVV